ncbi:1,3-beta-glucanosyltransferase GAS1 [Zancudomyces culisetae]|uniref:1,3-beta-glucanosyltransferase n=1 Tax=Zancudomyces culisetae TaxID=1213189 RepID=A0A1R1PP78_ZANCU|nr:1,3-beta-glucanosyltransferase GAS1 [Zancudomyces culisetae]OMH84531.1 1,3-beta-glucanosyltransferase GAS1 [Zancudomyces culisetae]|eukprot:OMH82682.1 1,3-beta-glucanosyltransferase GAS1 [Zancudomyces culisetae]
MKSLFLCNLLLSLSAVQGLNKIVIKGKKFFDSTTGNEFYIKGVAYQPETGEPDPLNRDPLADPVGCARDAPLLKELGANVIRVYQTLWSNNHDECMKTFSKNGIYVMLDVATPAISINRQTPYWTTDLFDGFRKKIDAFAGYDNVLGFIIGNEVANDKETTPSAAFVKAATRDVKAYLSFNKMDYPVGYASNDDQDIRDQLKTYFNCGDDDSARVDFYGLNLYSWCKSTDTLQTSGYDKVVAEYQSYSVPLLLTEYGCNTYKPRAFGEAKALYSSSMTDVFSGGFMYMYTQEENDYGIVQVSYGQSKVTKLEEFDNLKSVLTGASPQGVKMSSYSFSGSPEKCPSVGSTWKVDSAKVPPTPSTECCNCMLDSLYCKVDGNLDNGVDPQKYQSIISTICAKIDCSPIEYDTSKSSYGQFQFCTLQDRMSWALNQYYLANKKSSSSCGYDIVKGVVSASVSVSDDSVCAAKKNDVGTASNNSNAPQQSPSCSETRFSSLTFNTNVCFAVFLSVLLFVF